MCKTRATALHEISKLKQKKNNDYYAGSFVNIHTDWYVFEFKHTLAASALKMSELPIIIKDASTDVLLPPKVDVLLEIRVVMLCIPKEENERIQKTLVEKGLEKGILKERKRKIQQLEEILSKEEFKKIREAIDDMDLNLRFVTQSPQDFATQGSDTQTDFADEIISAQEELLSIYSMMEMNLKPHLEKMPPLKTSSNR